MLGLYYAVDRADASGELDAGTDAIDARFFTPAALAASDEVLKERHENPFWYPDLDYLRELAERALARGDGYADHVAPRVTD